MAQTHAGQGPVPTEVHNAAADHSPSIRLRHLPVFTSCFGARTADAGLDGMIWPVMSQSKHAHVIMHDR